MAELKEKAIVKVKENIEDPLKCLLREVEISRMKQITKEVKELQLSDDIEFLDVFNKLEKIEDLTGKQLEEISKDVFTKTLSSKLKDKYGKTYSTLLKEDRKDLLKIRIESTLHKQIRRIANENEDERMRAIQTERFTITPKVMYYPVIHYRENGLMKNIRIKTEGIGNAKQAEQICYYITNYIYDEKDTRAGDMTKNKIKLTEQEIKEVEKVAKLLKQDTRSDQNSFHLTQQQQVEDTPKTQRNKKDPNNNNNTLRKEKNKKE